MNWVSTNCLLVFNELDKMQMGKASLCHTEPSGAQSREAETAALLLLRQFQSAKWREHSKASRAPRGQTGWDGEEKDEAALTTAALRTHWASRVN